MSLTAVSLAWAFLQITVLCGVSLTLAWALRGRRPQFASALLTGACVASVFLALVATMPLCQWTFAIPEQIAKTESSLITNSLPKTLTSSKSNSIDISTQNPQSMDEPVEGSSDRVQQQTVPPSKMERRLHLKGQRKQCPIYLAKRWMRLLTVERPFALASTFNSMCRTMQSISHSDVTPRLPSCMCGMRDFRLFMVRKLVTHRPRNPSWRLQIFPTM